LTETSDSGCLGGLRRLLQVRHVGTSAIGTSAGAERKHVLVLVGHSRRQRLRVREAGRSESDLGAPLLNGGHRDGALVVQVPDLLGFGHQVDVHAGEVDAENVGDVFDRGHTLRRVAAVG
jgi:hypothetical protein